MKHLPMIVERLDPPIGIFCVRVAYGSIDITVGENRNGRHGFGGSGKIEVQDQMTNRLQESQVELREMESDGGVVGS